MSTEFHLAQFNIARALGTMDEPVMREFAENLERINGLADANPQFVWRLQSEQGDATDILAYEDESLLVNMSVWQSLDALRDYVYASEHLDFLKKKKHWFEKVKGPSLVLWWIPAGTLPSIEDGKQALEHLRVHGSSPRGFTFANPEPKLTAD